MGVKSTLLPIVSILSLVVASHGFAIDLPWKNEKSKSAERRKAIPYLGLSRRKESLDSSEAKSDPAKFASLFPLSSDPLRITHWAGLPFKDVAFEQFAYLWPLSSDPLHSKGWGLLGQKDGEFERFADFLPPSSDPLSDVWNGFKREYKSVASSGKPLNEFLLVAEPMGVKVLWPFKPVWEMNLNDSEKPLNEFLLAAEPMGVKVLWPFKPVWEMKLNDSEKSLSEFLLAAEPMGIKVLWPFKPVWEMKFNDSEKSLSEFLLAAEPMGVKVLWPFEPVWEMKLNDSEKSLSEFLLAAEPMGVKVLWPYKKEGVLFEPSNEALVKEEAPCGGNACIASSGTEESSGENYRSPYRFDCEPPQKNVPKISNRSDRDVCFRLASYLLGHGGFRYDKVTCETGILFPNNFEMLDDDLTSKNLQIYETGVKALAAFDENWYMKGFYSYGWIVHGHFSDSSVSGKQRGITQDALAGLGYLIKINRFCSGGLIGGWGFDEQQTRLRDAHPSQFDHLEFQSIWNGPWIGFDFYAWRQTSFVLNLGYEFHLANWRGAWLLDQELPNAFSDRRKAGMSFGQVVYLDLKWDLFSPHWRMDLEFKYQNWSTQSTGFLNSTGNAEFGSAPISGPVSAITFIKEAAWTSYGVSLNIGYSF